MSGPLFAFLSSVTWAIGSSGYSRLAGSYSAFSINFARALVALPLFIVAAFVSLGGWSEGMAEFSSLRGSHFGWFTLSMITSYGFGDVLFLWSTRALGVSVALAIASSYPIWTAIAGVIFRGESLSGLQFVGLFLAIIGMAVVILIGPASRDKQNLDTSKTIGKGLFLAFAASIMWALNSYSTAEGGKDLAAPVGNSIRMLLALPISAVLGLAMAPAAPLLLPTREIGRSLWLFVLEGFGGSYFYMYGLTHSSLAIGATLSSLAPVVAVPVAWFLGLEKFSISRTLGIVIVFVGLSLLIGAKAFF